MKKSKFFALIFINLLIFSLAFPRPMDLTDIFKFSSISSVKASPDGTQVIFIITKSILKENKRKKSLCLVKKGEPIPLVLTDRFEDISNPEWSPDGKLITFLGKKGEKNQIYYLPRRGESRLLFSFNESLDAYKWLPNGKGIVFTAPEPDPEREKKKAQGFDAIVMDEASPNLLWFWNKETNQIEKFQTNGLSVRDFDISEDCKKIALILSRTPLVNDMINSEIYVYSIKDKKLKKLSDNKIIESDIEWSKDGDYIFFLSSSNEKLEPYYQPSIFKLNPVTREILDLLPGFKYEVDDYFVSDADGKIYFIANEGVKVNLYKIDADGKNLKKLTNFEGWIRRIEDSTKFNEVLCIYSDPSLPFELFSFNIKTGEFIKITKENEWAEEIDKGKCETFYWRSKDGRTIEGIIYYPENFNPSKKYHLLVQLHGGPESSYKKYFSTSWSTYIYFWTGKGYIVFQPNYRGSTGYGDDVMRSIIGHYFEKDIDDIITGIKALKRKGWVNKIAVMGWSAGGHLTNWLITHFNIFSCASSGAGMSNWFSFYAQTDMRFIREIWHVGPPYERTDYYIKKSPIFYIDNAQTPTIIFCGEKDERVPLPQSREMYYGLKWRKVPTKLIVFPGEPHGLKKPAHQLYKMQEEFNWINNWINR